jgi:AraC family transcriptional regulator, transcriptional activator of pobA
MSQERGFQHFFLYGEPPRPTAEAFVHLELLDDRSRPANWLIRPHAHADLHQVFFVEDGGGSAEADAQTVALEGPGVAFVRAGVVHGFRWNEETQGRVLTFSDSILKELSGWSTEAEALQGRGFWWARGPVAPFAPALDRLSLELGWVAPFHDLALRACLASIVADVLRTRAHLTDETPPALRRSADIVARFRGLVEQSFRDHPSVEWYAERLGVSARRLRMACAEAAGRSPSQIQHDRLMLEARRLMRYSNMHISQIGLYLGFDDAAYFTRFFKRAEKEAPRAFRRQTGETGR